MSTDKVHTFEVLSIDRKSGKVLWQTKVNEEHPADNTHTLGSWASNSPMTDGKNLFAYFGSRGLYCLDMKGKVLWERNFGQMQKVMSFGEGSSPLLYKDKLYVGITTDLENRMRQHGDTKPLYYEGPISKSAALKRERNLKGWSRKKKLSLITKSSS